jgi:hypothetical protein
VYPYRNQMENDPDVPLREWLEDYADDGVVIMDGYGHCVVGLAEHFDFGPVLIYDRDLVIQSLMEEGLSADDAWDHFYYNMAGSYVGKRTPIFLTSTYPGFGARKYPELFGTSQPTDSAD